MARSVLIRALLLAWLTALPAWASDPLTGTWERGNPERGGGALRIIDEAGLTTFQLELWRGAPSYNMGFLEGKLSVTDAKASFVKREADWTCQVDFAFDGARVTLSQLQGPSADCGFGHAVSAEGTFVRKSRKRPVFQKPPQ